METQKFLTAEEFAVSLIPVLKGLGFRKRKLTWYKDNKDTTVVFHIQKSQWSKDVWYYSFGTDILPLSNLRTKSIDGCQINDRYDQYVNDVYLTPEKLLEMIAVWEQAYGTMDALLQRFQEHRLPYMTHLCAALFLATYSGVPEAEFDYEKYRQWIDLPNFHINAD